MQRIMNKLGISVVSVKDGIDVSTLKSFRTEFRPGTSQFVAGRKLVLIHGFIGKMLYKGDCIVKSIQEHFDNEFTIRETEVGHKRRTVVKQLFRNVTEIDFDSQSEFVVVWSRLSKDMLDEYIFGCVYGGCSCTHDCCGHWFSRVWSHKAKKFGPIHIVFIGHYRNV